MRLQISFVVTPRRSPWIFILEAAFGTEVIQIYEAPDSTAARVRSLLRPNPARPSDRRRVRCPFVGFDDGSPASSVRATYIS